MMMERGTIFKIVLALVFLYCVYWVYTEVFLSDIVPTFMTFALIVIAIIYYKSMVEA